MNRTFALLLLVATTACGTHQAASSDRTLPEVKVLELVGTQEMQMNGPFDVRYAVDVTNPSPEPITLKRIEVRQVGTGAYQLVNNTPVRVNATIEAGGNAQIAFWLHAYARVRQGEPGSNEPVSLRVVTFFDSPAGPFQRITMALLGQF